MRLRRVFCILWFAAVSVGSFLPLTWKVRLKTHGPFHLPFHFSIFLLSGFVAIGSKQSRASRISACIGVILFALSVEGMQALGNHFTIEWKDILIDSGGVALALLYVTLTDRMGVDVPCPLPTPECVESHAGSGVAR